MNTIKNALEKCRTYVAVQKFGCGHTGIGHGVEDNLLQLLNEAFEELARLEKREPTLMSDCISAGLPLDVALKYDVQLCRLTNYVRDKTLADCVNQEPVAYTNKDQVNELIKESARLICSIKDEGDQYLTAIDALRNAYRIGLKDSPVDAKAIRAEALEEAIKIVDNVLGRQNAVSAAIRSLKEKP